VHLTWANHGIIALGLIHKTAASRHFSRQHPCRIDGMAAQIATTTDEKVTPSEARGGC
jgi:hypothetical protein